MKIFDTDPSLRFYLAFDFKPRDGQEVHNYLWREQVRGGYIDVTRAVLSFAKRHKDSTIEDLRPVMQALLAPYGYDSALLVKETKGQAHVLAEYVLEGELNAT